MASKLLTILCLVLLNANISNAEYMYLSWYEVPGAEFYNLYIGETTTTMSKNQTIAEFAPVPNEQTFDALVDIGEVTTDLYVGITAGTSKQESKISNVIKVLAKDFKSPITTTTIPSICDLICN